MGGVITPAEIAAKVPKDAVDVYVRVDENKLYYVLKDDEIVVSFLLARYYKSWKAKYMSRNIS